MKKRVLTWALMLFMLGCFLVSCNQQTEPPLFTQSGVTESRDESDFKSEAESEVVSQDVPQPDEDMPEDGVKLLYTRYVKDRPSFVMIGTCAMDAVVTATIGDDSVTVPSYMGWFSVTFTKSGGLHEVTFTQTVNGEQYDIPRTYRAMPTMSTKFGEQEVISCESEFQFFLSKMIPDYEGKNLFPDSAMDKMVNRINSRMETLREYNPQAEIIYMVVPSPMTIYPELVPDSFVRGTEGNFRMDQVLSALETSEATVIDLRETFMLHKDDKMPLYYKLDSHWADYGAYLAYVKLFNHISQKFPDAAPLEMTSFNWNEDYYKSADVIMYLDIPQSEIFEYGYYREFNVDVHPSISRVSRYRLPQLLYSDESTYEKSFNTNRDSLPSCLVYRDSYGAGIYDLIPERMNNTHYKGMWNYSWDNYEIKSEKPDYIIYILAEFNLQEIVYN